jgi:hypothetical protein
MLPSSIQKTLMSKKYLIFTILAALLIFCIGLYGISLATRKVENFSMFGTCGEGSQATVCSGETPFCNITEKALPTDTLDQVLTFNTQGQYVEIVPNSTGSVELSQVAVYDSNGVNLALGKPVTASCISPTMTIGLPTTDDNQVVVVPRVFARYVRVRPGLQSDGYINMTQLMVLNASMTNLASGKPVYVTSSLGGYGDKSMITDNKTLKPKSGYSCWHTNPDSSPGKMSEYLEIDLGQAYAIHSIRYIGRLKADYASYSNAVNERNRPRIELSSYSAQSSTPTVSNSVTVDGTLTARVDLSQVCLMTGPSPVWRVDLGQSYKIAKIRYIGYNSGTGFYDVSKNSITPTDRNTGLRFRIKNDVNETTTVGTCIATPSYLEASYPPDATVDEKKILKPYATSGIDLAKVMCIYRTIKNNSTSADLHTKLMQPVTSGGCALTDQQVAKSYAKMKFNNMSLMRNGWVITGSWTSPGDTITLTSGLKPEIGMKIGKVTTSDPSVIWSMSDSDIIGVDSALDGKNFTISKTMTEPSGTDVKIKLLGLDRVDYNGGTQLLYADALSRVKVIKKLSDIDFDKETCVRDYIKNSTMKKKILNVDPSQGSGGNNASIVTNRNMTIQESDPIEAVTDVFTRVLLPAGSDPNSGYTGVNMGNDSLANNSWSTDVVGMLEGTPPAPNPTNTTLVANNPTDTQVAAAPRTFNLNRTTVSRDDMDAAAADITINYTGGGGDGTNEQEKEVYFVGGQFSSKEQAEQMCSAAKAELATPIQLSNAWRRGAQWCEPGWVSMTFEQANSEKTRILALINLWNTPGGYGKQLGDYNNLRRETLERVAATLQITDVVDARRRPYIYDMNRVIGSIFYDASGEGIWVKIADENETTNPFTLLNQFPWMGNSATVRYGYSFAWIEMTVPSSRQSITANIATFGGAAAATAQALVTRLENELNAETNAFLRGPKQMQLDAARAQLAATNADPRPGVPKEMQLKIKSPPIPPAIRNANYTTLNDMNTDIIRISIILAGLSANQFKAYKEFPAQQVQTISKTMENKNVVKMNCTETHVYTCPNTTDANLIDIQRITTVNITKYEAVKKPDNTTVCVPPCAALGDLSVVYDYEYNPPDRTLTNDLGRNHPSDPTKCLDSYYNGSGIIDRLQYAVAPASDVVKQTNCVCPTNYAAPSGTATTYAGGSSAIPKICVFQGSCPTGYSPYKNSKIACMKDTCDDGFYDVYGMCAREEFRACGLENTVVDKSSNTTAGAVCYGIKTSNRMTTIQIYDTPLQGTNTYTAPITKAISKTGRFVRLWPAIKTAKTVALNQNGQEAATRSTTLGVTVDLTANIVGTTGGNSIKPMRDCPANNERVTVTDVAGNASFYCRPRQCADSGYVMKNQTCVYLSWLALSQVVVKDRGGNIVSQGKNTYSYPPQSPTSPVQTNPKNLVNGTMQIQSVLDTNTGWLSDEYYDGDTDTFWQVDLGADIEIGTIDIYPNNYRNPQGGNYPYDSPGMSKTDIYDQITGIRIEISNSPRPLPFATRDSKVVWNDTAAFKQLDCVQGFYKKDCNDGKGVQCIVEGLGCPGDCPAGLNRDMRGTADAPPVGTCVLNIYNLADMQTLARSQIVKSDYYNADGSIDYNGFNAALNTANNKSKGDYCDLINAKYSTVNDINQLMNIKRELIAVMDPVGFVACDLAEIDVMKRAMEGAGQKIADDIKSCFPADALVTVRTRKGTAEIEMQDLKIGDEVLTAGGIFTPIYFFGHRNAFEKNEYVNLITKSATIRLSPEHYIPVGDTTLAGRQVVVGDKIWAKGKLEPVLEIKITTEIGQYNPYTMENTLIVDGVLASCCSESDEVPVESILRMFISCERTISRMAPSIYYAAFAPFRLTFLTNGVEWQQKYADAMGEKTAYKDLSLWKLVVNALTV